MSLSGAGIDSAVTSVIVNTPAVEINGGISLRLSNIVPISLSLMKPWTRPEKFACSMCKTYPQIGSKGELIRHIEIKEKNK